MNVNRPTIVNDKAHDDFIRAVVAAGLDPTDIWVDGYVAIAWGAARPFFTERNLPSPNSKVLEFGCNLGASSIMLANLGAQVTAIDINSDYVELARMNANVYGQSQHINFLHVSDTRKLPFTDSSFDLVVCNSVLEYVSSEHLSDVLSEIDRVLRKGGCLFVLGTSSSLWPREVHSRAWLVNYMPRFLDPIIRVISPDFMRGLSPCRLIKGFSRYQNLDYLDAGKSFLAAKAFTTSAHKHKILKIINWLCCRCGVSLGLVLPNITVALKKQDN